MSKPCQSAFGTFAVVCAVLLSAPSLKCAWAQQGVSKAEKDVRDPDNASKAAKDILSSIHQKQFVDVWDSQTSAWYKAKITKDSFIANLTLGRQPLGSVVDTKFVDMAYSQTDPSSGYQGEIYAFNYLTTYTVGKFYERVVVIKESDGKFRLSGLFGAPAPQ
jgi:hypothetical protein